MIEQLEKYVGELVILTWRDPATHAGWPDPNSVTPSLVTSVGWLVSVKLGIVRLAGSYCRDDDETEYGDITALPIGIVVAVRGLS